jgi:hypothetical protein
VTVSSLVPDDFAVPEKAALGSELRLEALTIHHAVRDYEAYLLSREHLESRMARLEPGWAWPAGLSLEDDLAEMGWHQGEFGRRSSFAYMLLPADSTSSLGCVYLHQASAPFDARLEFWVTAQAYDQGLEDRLVVALKVWLGEAWPFRSVLWPERVQ